MHFEKNSSLKCTTYWFQACCLFLLVCSSAAVFTSGCAGSIAYHPDGTITVQQGGRKTPAKITKETKGGYMKMEIETGSDPGKSPEEIKQEQRAYLIYIGAGLVVASLACFYFKHPRAGVVSILGGVGLIAFHEYPWAALILALGGLAAGMIYGYTKAEKDIQTYTLTEK